jgi:hypothetical protein
MQIKLPLNLEKVFIKLLFLYNLYYVEEEGRMDREASLNA